jgi:hypothetical protein
MRFHRQIAAAGLLGLSLVVAGCASERHDEIPPSALMTSEGDGQLAYMAPHDGDIYVFDTETDRMVYSGKIEKGKTITVDPEKDRISIDGATKLEQAINEGNRHRIFFDRDEDARTASQVEVKVDNSGADTRTRTETTEIRRDADDGKRVVEEKRTVETTR